MTTGKRAEISVLGEEEKKDLTKLPIYDKRLVAQWYFLVLLSWEVSIRVPSGTFVVQDYKLAFESVWTTNYPLMYIVWEKKNLYVKFVLNIAPRIPIAICNIL